MDIPGATFWWVAAGLAVAAELGTGTFYLLMIALGLAAAAVAAHVGLNGSGQIAVAAIVGGGATVLWHWRRSSRAPADLPAAQNRDVNLDIGERVHVARWAADRTARVQYRGSGWTARLAPDAQPQPGEHVVTAVEGNWLILAPLSVR
jgi:membrane protein implicated in regulation of membrane protease activity